MTKLTFNYIPIALAIFLSSCNNNPQATTKAGPDLISIIKNIPNKSVKQNSTGKTIKERFDPPEGFTRETHANNSFQYYLQNLPLKPADTKVKYFDGRAKLASDVYTAVVDMDIGKKNLQQCADAVMRLRAEHLYHQKKYDQIHFNFTNGFNAIYENWRKGKRIKVAGNKVNWTNGGTATNDYNSFLKYMEKVFMYAGTLSLSQELKSKPIEKLSIGDIFIQGGSPGHAIIVVDKAVNNAGKVVFMLAQSYMPAQDIQILQNPNNRKLSPWYDLDFGEMLDTPEWRFSKNDLKTF